MRKYTIWNYKEGKYLEGSNGLPVELSSVRAEAVAKKLAEVDHLLGENDSWEDAREDNYLVELIGELGEV